MLQFLRTVRMGCIKVLCHHFFMKKRKVLFNYKGQRNFQLHSTWHKDLTYCKNGTSHCERLIWDLRSQVISNSSFSMQNFTVLTAALWVLGMPLLFSFSNTHLHFHTLLQTVNNAALCYKPEAFSSLAFWLFHSA